MRSRGLVVVLALILATLATAGVFLYSRGVRENALEGGDLRSVVVATVDIPANTDLNEFIRDGQFVTIEVPQDAAIDDPVTQISQLQNQRNSVFIFANEQIPIGRIRGGQVPGGLLSIPEGYQAITVALEAPRAISGSLTGGDNISIYATFQDITLTAIDERSLRRAVKDASRPSDQNTTENTGTQGEVAVPTFDATVTLVPQAEVLRVIRPSSGGGIAGEQTNSDDSSNTTLQIILALTPEDAQKFVFAAEQGTLYTSLLPPDEEGVEQEPLTVAEIILPGNGRNG
ncbi:MAG TPA: RcpC/CpaB family pilus assembly protein [Actinomycetota bacterium]|nr:RcpC/CpaB family pilus assembly protein [Actinomycetota bacterium]